MGRTPDNRIYPSSLPFQLALLTVAVGILSPSCVTATSQEKKPHIIGPDETGFSQARFTEDGQTLNLCSIGANNREVTIARMKNRLYMTWTGLGYSFGFEERAGGVHFYDGLIVHESLYDTPDVVEYNPSLFDTNCSVEIPHPFPPTPTAKAPTHRPTPTPMFDDHRQTGHPGFRSRSYLR